MVLKEPAAVAALLRSSWWNLPVCSPFPDIQGHAREHGSPSKDDYRVKSTIDFVYLKEGFERPLFTNSRVRKCVQASLRFFFIVLIMSMRGNLESQFRIKNCCRQHQAHQHSTALELYHGRLARRRIRPTVA
jgi:hypothetical protein